MTLIHWLVGPIWLCLRCHCIFEEDNWGWALRGSVEKRPKLYLFHFTATSIIKNLLSPLEQSSQSNTPTVGFNNTTFLFPCPFLPHEKFRTRCDIDQWSECLAEMMKIFLDNPPPTPFPPEQIYIFCPKGNASNQVCQVKFSPEKLRVLTLRRKKNTELFLTLSKKSVQSCSHGRQTAITMQQRRVDHKHRRLLEVAVKLSSPVCFQNTATTSHTRLHFVELTTSEATQ